jgi:hypothetical protein
MAQVREQEIDRSLTAIFDIVGYSKEDPQTMAKSVGSFIRYLDKSLKELGDIKPDAFSTGDGAIVSIGRNCRLDKRNTKLFMDFTIDFALRTLRTGLIIKTVINYAERDRVLVIQASETIQGKYIQIGDSINIATRIMTFCEPGEILINESVYDFLRTVGLRDKYPFVRNEPFTTKHDRLLKTFSYDPPEGQRDCFYSPHSPSQQYKKYSYFPPVKSEIIEYFTEHGLDFEIRQVISESFDAVRELNDTRKFMSYHSVLDVLMQLHYDPADSVYVLSRNDRASGFWTQPRRNKFINHLSKCASRCGGYTNQTRVIVYDDSEPFDASHAYDVSLDLMDLHGTNTLFSFPSSCLLKYEKLNELIFGFTLSRNHGYAVISMPAPEAFGMRTPKLDDIGATLKLYEGYDVVHGPMRAIITADKRYVEELIKEMDELRTDLRIHRLK